MASRKAGLPAVARWRGRREGGRGRVLARVIVEKILEMRHAVEQRADVDQSVAPPREMRGRARMRPLRGARDQAGANRVQREIARRRDQMILIHRARGEAPLEQMAGDARAGVEIRGVAPMRLPDRLAPCRPASRASG